MPAAVAVDCNSSAPGIPSPRSIRRWVRAALPPEKSGAGICVRIVDEEEGRRLNARYRRRKHATNVLAFPAALPPGPGLELLGDLVVCAPVVSREAREQGKPPRAHWAHLMVHGTLHLLGFDHHDDADAARMEQREREVLATLKFPDPYAWHEPTDALD